MMAPRLPERKPRAAREPHGYPGRVILAVDTSIGSTVAVVGLDGSVRAEAESESPRGHAEVIGDLLVSALDRAGAGPGDITYVAAGMGPGPFTGLRIGIAAARAFAIGRDLPVVPVVSHDAAALALLGGEQEGTAQDSAAQDARPRAIAIVTDARRRENAVSVYRGLDAHGLPHRIIDPELHPQADDLAVALAASGAAEIRTAEIRAPEIRHVSAIRAADLGRVAARMVAAGVVPGTDEPLYLRSPDVAANHTRKRVST